ncbi:MAG: T9SS type A sorting domain-containing protein, partial [Flavobacteriales bacterium]|nr:T9SS type A sorting domain-containing protein [Flavobacteriales bacterium]
NYSVPFNSGSQYTWSVIGGTQISGGQTNAISVLWVTTGTAQISVVEEDSMGCRGDTVYTLVNVITSISENGEFPDVIRVYPNPNSGQFAIEMNVLRKSSISIDLFNFTGQLVHSDQTGDIKGQYVHQIDMYGLAKGVYFVRVVTDRGTATKKVVRQNTLRLSQAF